MGRACRHSSSIRRVFEQHVHFLELLPFMGVSFVTIAYCHQVLTLFGIGQNQLVLKSVQSRTRCTLPI